MRSSPGLIARKNKDRAVEIIEAEIRSAQHEILLDVERLAWVSGAGAQNIAKTRSG